MKIIKLNPESHEPAYIREAAEVLSGGGLVIIPTETVYGIAADMSNKKTLDRLYEIKKRPKE
ncbi:MAG: Sua5/YciO/YrdC/YwlC family protein, partial [Candidatus Omnitrophota bacterium]